MPTRQQVWLTLGATDVLSIAEAREQAREVIKRLKSGKRAVEPVPPPPQSFAEVAWDWVARHLIKNGVRTRVEIERCLRRYILPRLGDREFVSVGRADISRLLDHLEDAHGSRQADVCLGIIRSVTSWFATRDDTYRSPVVPGMRRHGNQARTRTLDDSELQLIWRAAEQAGAFGSFIRFALLTGQRRGVILRMRWADLSPDGVWTIALSAREKGNAGSLKLPQAALDIINAMPRINAYVFAGRSNSHCTSWGHAKRDFDKQVPLPQWCVHDLRRTARSLLSRAEVQPHIAEKLLGHVVGGVEQTYDRHKFTVEKGDALARLASLIESIVTPPSGNVVR